MLSSPAPYTTATDSPWWRCAASRPGCTSSLSYPLPAPVVRASASPERLPAGVERRTIDILLAMLKGHMETELA